MIWSYLCIVLQLALIVIKLMNIVSWSWWIILMPAILIISLNILILVIILILGKVIKDSDQDEEF